MEREERRHQRARPHAATKAMAGRHGRCHPPEQPEEQHDISRVQHNADEMVGARVQAEELAVEHVRQAGQRVPVARHGPREGPDQTVRRQPALDVLI